MTLLIRDEGDILRENIEYHLAQGVDFIVATNHLSVDDSREILAEYDRAGVLHLIDENEAAFLQGAWVTRMARLAEDRFQADWIINNDADEFWMPVEGTLKEWLVDQSESVHCIKVRRSNFIPTADETAPFYERMVIRETASVNPLGKRLPSKVCHRAMPEIVVADGNHSVIGLRNAEVKRTDAVEIMHFPLRRWAQFERKIKCGGALVRGTPGPSASTWRDLYRLHEAGRLRDYYDAQIQSQSAIAEGLASGSLRRDDRLRGQLRTLQRNSGASQRAVS
jgi:hypothetical protein